VRARACEGLICKYDRQKGGFRKWFATVICTESLLTIRKLRSKPGQRGVADVIANLPTVDPNEEQIQRECLTEVLRQMREYVEKRAAVEGATSKWRVFALVYFHELVPADFDLTRVLKEVAAKTGKTVNAVSIDCCRVRAILQQDFGDALED
jgi:hypothetical protein